MGASALAQTRNKHLTVGAAALFLSTTASSCYAYYVPPRTSGFVSVGRPHSQFGHRTQIDTNFDATWAVRHRDDTRSWGSELGLAPPEALADLWTSYNEALDTAPLITKSVTAGVILGSADLAGQAIEGAVVKKDKSESGEGGSASVDLARVIRFAVFGLVLQAPWNHFYYQVLDGALPPTENPYTATTAVKVVIDQFVQAPIFTVLIFGFLGLLEGKTLDMIRKQLDDDYVDTMLANWKLWVPATMVNIAFCPPVLRVLFLNVVFFFWSIFLSLKLNKGEAE